MMPKPVRFNRVCGGWYLVSCQDFQVVRMIRALPVESRRCWRPTDWLVDIDHAGRLAVDLHRSGRKLTGITQTDLDEWARIEADEDEDELVAALRCVFSHIEPNRRHLTYRALTQSWHPDRGGTNKLQSALNRIGKELRQEERCAAA